MPENGKMLTVNTLITSAGTVMAAIIGWLIVHELQSIEESQKHMSEVVVPRREHEVRWDEDKSHFLRLEADLISLRTEETELRSRVLKLELEHPPTRP